MVFYGYYSHHLQGPYPRGWYRDRLMEAVKHQLHIFATECLTLERWLSELGLWILLSVPA